MQSTEIMSVCTNSFDYQIRRFRNRSIEDQLYNRCYARWMLGKVFSKVRRVFLNRVFFAVQDYVFIAKKYFSMNNEVLLLEFIKYVHVRIRKWNL